MLAIYVMSQSRRRGSAVSTRNAGSLLLAEIDLVLNSRNVLQHLHSRKMTKDHFWRLTFHVNNLLFFHFLFRRQLYTQFICLDDCCTLSPWSNSGWTGHQHVDWQLQCEGPGGQGLRREYKPSITWQALEFSSVWIVCHLKTVYMQSLNACVNMSEYHPNISWQEAECLKSLFPWY